METYIEILVIVVLMALKGFFSGSEIAIVNSDKIKMRHRAKMGHKGATLLLKRFQNPDIILGTTLIGTNVATVGVSTLGTLLFIDLFGQGGDMLAVLFFTPFMLIFGEIVPKSIYQQKANTIASIIIFPLTFMTYVLYPFIFVFSRFARFFTKMVSGKSTTRSPYITREEIRSLLDMPESSSATEDEDRRFDKERVRSIIRYAETNVGSAMIPLSDIHGIAVDASMEEAMALSAANNISRVPVYSGNLTNIVGILTLKTWDLMDETLPQQKIADRLQPAIFIPPRQTIHEILPTLLVRNDRMAVVVDEFGSAMGMLFLEDLFMEVIGDMPEGDKRSGGPGASGQKNSQIKTVGEDVYEVSGRMPITELNEELNTQLPVEEAYTVAGLLVNRMRTIPKQGSSLVIQGLLFEVMETDGRAVTKVSLQRV
ncbi:MAG: HlyC/CorC family transporter [Magnetococcales bacterium]|nr:HlyC/CorC family transporter [Magnetococcales bacterium]